MNRHEAREQALRFVFELEFAKPTDIAELIENAKECREEEIAPYAEKALSAVCENLAEIDSVIDTHSSKWRVGRLPKSTLAILRLAVAEIKYLGEPVGAIINEAVTLAKVYCGDDDPAYINGVLGGFSKEALPEA